MNKHFLRDDCEVAVIGAGPYGLAIAAHLRAAKIATRVFGKPMSFWRDNMPKGMRLRSPWIATHIADPEGRYSLDTFGIEQQDQLPLERFVGYGEWFQRSAVPDLDTRKVIRVEETGRGYRLVLDSNEAVYTRRVVVATGLANQEFRPAQFQGLPPALVSHTCEHASLDKWRGKRVAVVGRGQSACESAALLWEAGSDVDLICRGEVRWIGAPRDETNAHHDLRWQLREMLQAPSAVGPFPWNWLNELPGIERRIPARLRSWIAARSLRAAAAWWLKPRFDGVRVLAGQEILGARAKGHQIEVQMADGLHGFDHVLLATGYHIDISRLGFLAPGLLAKIATSNDSPVLGAAFESTAAGLHFVGSNAVDSYGPLMRFISGSGYTARTLTRAVLIDGKRSMQGELRYLLDQADLNSVDAARH
jgi:Pyridine nucleotide-disulphide oxidoreductase